MTRHWSRAFRLGPIVVLAVIASTVTYGTSTAADTGLVLGYGFERVGTGTVIDSSPSGLDGLLLGSPALPGRATSVKGHGKALTFDSAQQQFVDAGSATALDLDHFTLAAWVRYLPNVHDDRWEVLEKAGAYWMNIRTDTRRLRVGGFFGGCSGGSQVWRYVDSKKVLPASTWVHVAGTYDGSALRIYVNGVLDNTLAVTGHTCVNTSPLGIGAKNRTATGVVEAYFDGRIDDLRVYNRALGASEIKAAKAAPLT
jgi:Concanavalin A-like lectin/glucanases superfamily